MTDEERMMLLFMRAAGELSYSKYLAVVDGKP